jgi:hypothetical protein
MGSEGSPFLFMNVWQEMESDAPEILKELGRVVIYRKNQVLAMVDPNPIDSIMTQGGFDNDTSFRVKFFAKSNSELIRNPPSHGEQVTVYGSQYTIVSITYRPPSPWIETVVQPTDGNTL